jgi:hypothetical protein
VKKKTTPFPLYGIVYLTIKIFTQRRKDVIKIDTTTERIERKGGLVLAGKLAIKAALDKIHSGLVKNAAAIVMSLYGLMVEGKTDFESMKEKRGSLFFQEALNLPFVYAKETVRLYLEDMAAEADTIIEQLRGCSDSLIRKAPLHGLWIAGKKYLPVDIDTSVLDNSKTKKEGVSRTYQGYDGYHPIFAYLGKEGYMLDCELRPGSQHCQKGTVAFIEGLLKRLEAMQAGKRYIFRLDSGNDAWETLREVGKAGKGYYCILKRNKRKEGDEVWLKRARRLGKRVAAREGKQVWIGAVKIHPRKKGERHGEVYCVFEVIRRETDREGNRLLIAEVEVNSWWTNLECGAEKVIELYHGHGTSEQYHSELKSDMGVERLPSGKFEVNRIVLAVAMNAYNALRVLGQKSVETGGRKKFKRKRLGKVIGELICVAGKVVRHAGQLVLKIYEGEAIAPLFLRLDVMLDSL